MTSVLDLKNSKNHKKKKNHSFSDILDGDKPVELGVEPAPAEDIDPIDNQGPIQNNALDMAPLSTFASASLVWTGSDRHHELISHSWRKGIIILLVAMAFLALFWQGSILTAITFFALAIVTSMHFWREASNQQYEIHPHGILAGDNFYHYRDLNSFWVEHHPNGFHELSLCTGNLLNYYIKIPLKELNPLEVRNILIKYLPEEKHEEGLEDLLRRKLGL